MCWSLCRGQYIDGKQPRKFIGIFMGLASQLMLLWQPKRIYSNMVNVPGLF